MEIVHARIPIDPDSREEALDQIADLAEASRAESGVVDYRATTEIGDENVVHVFERYEDAAAREAHGETDHYGAFEAALPGFIGGDLEIRTFRAEGDPEVTSIPLSAFQD